MVRPLRPADPGLLLPPMAAIQTRPTDAGSAAYFSGELTAHTHDYQTVDGDPR